MYDVIAMKKELENAKLSVSEKIHNEFKEAFISFYKNNSVPDNLDGNETCVTKTKIKTVADIENIYSGAGLYLILSSRIVNGNTCSLKCGNLQVIYRGECSTVKQRAMSHLFHSTYKIRHEANKKTYEEDSTNAGKTFYKAFWPHCLKLEAGGKSGIDVDQPPYSSHEWILIVHRMHGSSQDIRKIAELAFDDAFGHPAASRDVAAAI